MAKTQKIPKTEELPDIFDLVLAGLLLGYSADYLRQQSIKGNFPGYQLFDDGKRGAWRVNKQDLLDWLERKRAGAKYYQSEGQLQHEQPQNVHSIQLRPHARQLLLCTLQGQE